MKVKFNNKEYRNNGRNGTALKFLCFDIFKEYLKSNNQLNYQVIKNIFNKWHCNNNFVVLSKNDWTEKTEDLKSRYFDPIDYNLEKLYFTTQWGNNGGNCDNINNMIEFAKEQRYDIQIIDDNTSAKTQYEEVKIKNIILYGAPGVGKTHNYQNIISMIENNENQKEIFDTISNNLYVEQNSDIFQNIQDEKRVEFITFHQSYSYEDFIEGFRPNENGNIKLEDGIFKKLCDDAYKNKEKNYYIVIDEINRGNISKIFGELITLIEEDKRDSYEVTLPYSKTPFHVPSNLYIIATMNSTDKSIATIDIALRRRFTFLRMLPNLDLVKFPYAKGLMEKLNVYIKDKLGEDYMLGHSYFMKVQNEENLEFVIEYKIKPLLEEYFYADGKSADEIIGEALKIKDNND